MKFLPLVLLLGLLACGTETQRTDKADAYRDLLLDRVIWKKSDGKTPINLHRFTVTNTSDSYAYDQIEVRFDYFDSTYHKINSSSQVLNKSIGPRAALVIGEVQDGPALANTKSSTVTVVKANGHQAEPEK